MITGLLHTRNRPAFVARAMAYYADKFRGPILVADGSDERRFAELKARLAEIDVAFPLEILHHPMETPFCARIADAVKKVRTPYVLLMADDDLYLPSWEDTSVAHLERHTECGVVYGHTLRFELARADTSYVPFGQVRRLYHGKHNPVARWMEHETAIERLNELGRGAWATTGWYAVQRTKILEDIVAKAISAELDPEMFERLLTVLQPIYGKVAMLDTLYVARQFDPMLDDSRKLTGYRAAKRSLERLARITTDTLVDVGGTDRATAETTTKRVLAPLIRVMKEQDVRDRLNVPHWKAKLPPAVHAVRALRVLRDALLRRDPLATDPRFPPKPGFESFESASNLVSEACRAPEARRRHDASRSSR